MERKKRKLLLDNLRLTENDLLVLANYFKVVRENLDAGCETTEVPDYILRNLVDTAKYLTGSVSTGTISLSLDHLTELEEQGIVIRGK